MSGIYISVDTETSGVDYLKHNLLSIGAFTQIKHNTYEFYTELKPLEDRVVQQEAMQTNSLNIEDLQRYGNDPDISLLSFTQWVFDVKSKEQVRDAIFVGFNAAFDWGFLTKYFHDFNVANPFYYAPIDIKSMYFGQDDIEWRDTTGPKLPAWLSPGADNITHNAIEDATAQFFIFKRLMKERERLHGLSRKTTRQLEMI